MSPTLKNRLDRIQTAAAGLVLAVCLTASMAVRADSIPRPEGIQPDVNFWIRVYTEVTTNEGFLHDERNLTVVYDTLKFGAGTSPRERQRQVDDRRSPDRSRARGAFGRRQTAARPVGAESQPDPVA